MADKSFGVKELNLLNTSGTPTITSPNTVNLNATNVAISTNASVGNNLTVTGNIIPNGNVVGDNATNISGISSVTATTYYGSGANLTGISAGISTASTNIQATWDVVNNGASAYRFTGPGQDGAEDNPNVYLVRGQRYRFSVNASGHPFQLRVSNGGSAYTDGVTNNGATSGNVEINVQHDAPAQLVYQCTNHGGMVGNIYIVGQHLANGANNRVLTATSAYGMNGEANLTFDGTTLDLTGNYSVKDPSTASYVTHTFASNYAKIDIRGTNIANSNHYFIGYGAGHGSANEFHMVNIVGDMAFRTGGSGLERVRITSGGQTLINQTAALDSGVMLGVKNPTSNDTVVDVVCGSTTAGSHIAFSDDAYARGLISYNHANNFLAFRTNGVSTDRLHITSAGEVLIGRTSKANDINKLVVTGTSPADTFDSTLYLEGSETSGAVNTGGALAFGGHDGGAARNWGNIYGMKENGAGNNTAGYMSFHTRPAGGSPTERLRITSGGALGTNSTVRSAYGGLDLCSKGATNYGTLTLGAGGGENGQSRNSNQENQFRIMCPTYANPSNMFTVMYGASGSSLHEINYGGGTGWAYAANLHRFFTTANQTTGTGTERLRINSSGYLLTNGNTSLPTGSTQGFGFSSDQFYLSYASSGANYSQRFYNSNGLVGSILVNGSSTTYNTSSDYRLKENTVAISDGITRLKLLKPYRFNFIKDASTTLDGFYAHEAQSVVPQSATGTKDEVETSDNEDTGAKVGDPIYQGMDHSALIPLLTAALQEAIAKIETLESEVATLKSS